MPVNTPTILTLFRLIVSPILLPALLIYLLPLNVLLINAALAAVFMLLSLTDFLDGYLARSRGQSTLFGKVFDPIADKFLIYATLIALLVVKKIFFVWVIIFIGREFFVLGLRILALEHKFSLPEVWLSKMKTFAQMMYLAVAIANPYHDFTVQASLFNQVEQGLLAAALVLTVWTAYRYYRAFVKGFSVEQKHHHPL
jgi:CDP-diacylglycerol--glycerol-3-phosphate 3-phosphatidyltransferase